MSKTLYHSELTKMGPVTVEVKSDVKTSKYQGKPDYVDIAIDGNDRTYNVENGSCADVFRGRRGQRITIEASGSRDAAIISLCNDEGTHAAPRQSAAPAARQGGDTKPHGATVGMAINCACANLTARGEMLEPHEVACIASDLLRVAAWLEAGNLEPKRAEREREGGAE